METIIGASGIVVSGALTHLLISTTSTPRRPDGPAVPSTFHDFTYVAFERSGHYPFCVESELFDMALLEWLAAPRGTDP